jgi:ABC-type dipeptide/oligopeptide/nickel transport system ATPase component
MNADRIIVVEHGQIVEQGAHTELIVANGRYADLWSKQVFLKPEEQKGSTGLPENVAKMDDTTMDETASSNCDKKGIVRKNDEVDLCQTLSQNNEADSAEDGSSLADSDLLL